MEGTVLVLKRSKLSKSFQKKFFVVENFNLNLHDNESDRYPQKTIDLRDVISIQHDFKDLHNPVTSKIRTIFSTLTSVVPHEMDIIITTVHTSHHLRFSSMKEHAFFLGFVQVFDGLCESVDTKAHAPIRNANETVKHLLTASIPIPLPVIRGLFTCIDYLHQHCLQVDGIFRIAGDSVEIKSLVHLFLSNTYVIPYNEVTEESSHNIADAFKRLLRMMPETLLTNLCFRKYMEYSNRLIANIKDSDVDLANIRALTLTLPLTNQILLHRIILFLNDLLLPNNVEFTQMTIKNLAIVLGPNLLMKDGFEVIDMVPLFTVLTRYHSSIFAKIPSHIDFDVDENQPNIIHTKARRPLPPVPDQATESPSNKLYGGGLMNNEDDNTTHAQDSTNIAPSVMPSVHGVFVFDDVDDDDGMKEKNDEKQRLQLEAMEVETRQQLEMQQLKAAALEKERQQEREREKERVRLERIRLREARERIALEKETERLRIEAEEMAKEKERERVLCDRSSAWRRRELLLTIERRKLEKQQQQQLAHENRSPVLLSSDGDINVENMVPINNNSVISPSSRAPLSPQQLMASMQFIQSDLARISNLLSELAVNNSRSPSVLSSETSPTSQYQSPLEKAARHARKAGEALHSVTHTSTPRSPSSKAYSVPSYSNNLSPLVFTSSQQASEYNGLLGLISPGQKSNAIYSPRSFDRTAGSPRTPTKY